MVTYLYWSIVLLVISVVIYAIGFRAQKLVPSLLIALAVLLVSFIAYYFGLQQVFVKHYGGVMTVRVPDGQQHIMTTWKDDNLWIENYDPETNTCYFTEYSRGNLLQGRVTITNCTPIAAQ